MSARTLVIASGNAGKIREFAGLLEHLPLTVRPQPEGMEVEETGLTFAENARIKARAWLPPRATGPWPTIPDSVWTPWTGHPVCFPPATPKAIPRGSPVCSRGTGGHRQPQRLLQRSCLHRRS